MKARPILRTYASRWRRGSAIRRLNPLDEGDENDALAGLELRNKRYYKG